MTENEEKETGREGRGFNYIIGNLMVVVVVVRVNVTTLSQSHIIDIGMSTHTQTCSYHNSSVTRLREIGIQIRAFNS